MIKRYDMEREYYDQAFMAESENGEYVRYEDADRLQSERDALAAEVSHLTADRDCWADQASERVKDWDEMRKRAEKAEAEVEELRAAIEEIAQQWDGCQYASVACDIDIGEAIRSAVHRLLAARTTGEELQ